MKKIIPGLILLTLLSLLVVPIIAEAQPVAPVDSCTIRTTDVALIPDCVGVPAVASYDEWAICCVMDKVYMITNWIFWLVLALSIIFILYGGFLIVAAGGSEERVTKGRTFIMWAIIGFVVAVLARALPMIAYYFVS